MNDKMLKSLLVFKIGMKKIMTSSAQNAAIDNTILASNQKSPCLRIGYFGMPGQHPLFLKEENRNRPESAYRT